MVLRGIVMRHCPFCRHAVSVFCDRRARVDTTEAGRLSVCEHCCGLSILSGHELRLPTPQELASAMRDRHLVRTIKDLRASKYGVSVF